MTYKEAKLSQNKQQIIYKASPDNYKLIRMQKRKLIDYTKIQNAPILKNLNKNSLYISRGFLREQLILKESIESKH